MACSCKARIKYPNRMPLSPEKLIRNAATFLIGGVASIFIPRFTIPMLIGQQGCLSIDETIKPNADVFTSDYFPTPHHTELSVRTDTDTIEAGGGGPFLMQECGSGVDLKRFIVALETPVGSPGPKECQGARYRFRFRKLESGTDPGGETYEAGVVDVNVLRVRQGSTTKIEFDHGTIGTSYTTLTRTFTEAQYESITDWPDVQLYMDADLCATVLADGGPGVEVPWCEIELYTL